MSEPSRIDPPASDSGETALIPGYVVPREPLANDPSLSPGALLGRYLVVGEAGQGGMGVVVRAYDPKLRREVALKRLRIAGGAAHAQAGALGLLREARAMARLAHPNVLAVYDVEEIETRSYLVMEYVEGTTLQDWIAGGTRPWPELLAMLVQAGRGLAAAHAVGLVHRDFKPGNVLIGSDPGSPPRARVMDFGLARGADEGETSFGPDASASANVEISEDMLTAGEVLGTPAYMAPEQHVGLVADARADQYSWCLTLWEALAGRRPFIGSPETIASAKRSGVPTMPPSSVPRWLVRVIERGMSPAPEARFPSMDALLVEIERGRNHARRRQVVLGIAGAATLVLGAYGLHVLDRRDRVRACELEGERIDELWNEDARNQLRDGLIATRIGYGAVTAEKVMPWIDAQAIAWQQARTQVCLDDDGERSGWSRDVVSRALWCLDERRMEIDALVSELTRADAKVVHKAVQAAAGLTQIAPCREPELLLRLPSPPTEHVQELQEVRAELSRASVLERAGKYDASREVAERALERATVLDWPPLVAAAHQRLGFVLDRSGDYAEAERALEAAYFEASRAGALEVAAAAADKLVFTVGYRQARHDDGLRWAKHAEVVLDALGEHDGLRTAGHLDKLAVVHAAHGDYAEAEALHERALTLKLVALGEGHPDVASSLNNLATVHQSMAAWDQAKPLHERALAIRERTLGPDHPDVAMSLANLGVVADATGQYGQALALYERALTIREAALGPDHPDVAGTLNNLGNVREAMGDHAEAAQLFERALATQERVLGPDHPDVATSLANLALVRMATGQLADARALLERALAIREKALGPEHAEVASSLDNLGLALARSGQPAELERARALHERAMAIREKVLGPEHPDLASTLNNLGQVYLRLGQTEAAERTLERSRAIRRLHGGENQPGD